MNQEPMNKKVVFVAFAAIGFALTMALSGCGGGGTSTNARSSSLLVTIGSGGQEQLYKINLNTGVKTQITFGPDSSTSPTSSGPNMPIFFYRSTNSTATSGLAKVNADGSGFQLIGPITSSWGLRISNDGSKLISYRNNKVFVIDAVTGTETAIVSNSAYTGGGHFSPDGTKVVYNCLVDGEFDVWTVNANGSNPTNLMPGAGSTGSNPYYSPDGSKIAFNGDDVGSSQEAIWVMNADGTGRTKIATFGSAFCNGWTPDGQWIVIFDASQPDGSIKLVKADGSGQTKTIYTESTDEVGWIGNVVGA